jgi:hypothetical protein
VIAMIIHVLHYARLLTSILPLNEPRQVRAPALWNHGDLCPGIAYLEANRRRRVVRSLFPSAPSFTYSCPLCFLSVSSLRVASFLALLITN